MASKKPLDLGAAMLFCGKKEKKNTCSLTPVQMESESRKSKRPKKPLTKRVADGLPWSPRPGRKGKLSCATQRAVVSLLRLHQLLRQQLCQQALQLPPALLHPQHSNLPQLLPLLPQPQHLSKIDLKQQSSTSRMTRKKRLRRMNLV